MGYPKPVVHVLKRHTVHAEFEIKNINHSSITDDDQQKTTLWCREFTHSSNELGLSFHIDSMTGQTSCRLNEFGYDAELKPMSSDLDKTFRNVWECETQQVRHELERERERDREHERNMKRHYDKWLMPYMAPREIRKIFRNYIMPSYEWTNMTYEWTNMTYNDYHRMSKILDYLE